MKAADCTEILNYHQMTDRIGTSGQPTPEQFVLIQGAGYRSVINLALPDSDQALPDEAALVTRLGLNYFHIPVPFDSPSPEQLRLFCRLLQSLEETEGHRVWVHCILNYRVAAFVYHYLTKIRGLDESEARSPIFETWSPNAIWSELLAWDRERVGV